MAVEEKRPAEQVYRVELKDSGNVAMIPAKSAEQARLKYLYGMFEVSSRPATEAEIEEHKQSGGQVW